MSKVYKSGYINIGTPKPIEDHSGTKKDKAAVPAENAPGMGTNVKSDEAVANSIIEDAKQMYLKIIEEANLEAKKITEEAAVKAEKLRKTSRQEGYNEGFEAGYSDGKGEAAAILDEAAEIRAFLDGRREQLYKEAEGEIVNLVLEISKKVIGDELEQNRDAIFSLVGQALQKCAFKNKLLLRVAPEDYDYVSANRDRISRLVEGVSDIEIFSDLSLKKGGCVIETPSGEINSSADLQMKELEKIFLYTLGNE